MFWHNFKTWILFELETLPPSVAHGEVAIPEPKNIFPVCKWAPTSFGWKSVKWWIQRRIKAKKPTPKLMHKTPTNQKKHQPVRSCLSLALSLLPFCFPSCLSLYHQFFPILVSFPTRAMPDMSCIVHKLHLVFMHNLLFHIFFLFCTTSLIFFSVCHCFYCELYCIRTLGPRNRDNFLLSVKHCEKL